MPSILDRYVIREVLPPFLLSLLVFSFLLILDPIMTYAEALLSRGVPPVTVIRLILTLVPQALGVAIPVAVLVGLLIGLGRLSGDREIVALLAGGVSPYRLLRPVGALATVAAAATLWVMVLGIPDANQTFREITFSIIAQRVQEDIQPRVFFEEFPGKVLYVRDAQESQTGWNGVFLGDTTRPGWPTIYVAEQGHLNVDRAKRTVDLVLLSGQRHTRDEILAFGTQILGLDPEHVFPRAAPARGINEMTISDLREQAEMKHGQQVPAHNEVMAIHQKFAFPVACLVFGLAGLALGITSRRDGKLAAFVIGMGVVLLYWAIHILAEAMARGQFLSAEWARWVPSLVLGPLAVGGMVWKARWTEGRLPIAGAISAVRARVSRWGERPKPGAPARAPHAAAPRVVLVVRVPRVHFSFPGILDRYVAGIYLRVAALTFIGLLGLFYIADFIDRSAYVFKGQTTPGMLLAYFWYSSPQFIYYVLPLSVLIATLVTIGVLTKTSELTVIKACGVSLYRCAAPLLFVAVVASGLLFVLEDTVLAIANQRADALNRTMRGRPPRTFNPANPNWLVGKNGALYHYTMFDPARHYLLGLSIYEFDPGGLHIVRETAVDRADFRDGVWTTTTGWSRTYRDRGARLASQVEQFSGRRLSLEPPDYFETERTSAQMMTISQLRRHVAELQSSGFNVTRYRVDLQRKMAFPFVTVVMTLLAVPFAVTTGRRGALYGIGAGIVLAIAYWLLTSLFAAVGSAGLLAPALAAWAPNVLVGTSALYLTLTVRT